MRLATSPPTRRDVVAANRLHNKITFASEITRYRRRVYNVLITSLLLFVSLPQYASADVCTVASAGQQQWRNSAFTPQKGRFTASWEVTPLQANVDALVAVSSGPKTNWSGLAAIVRFNSGNTIDVRNGDQYMADTTLAYVANMKHYVRMTVDIPSHTYSVYVRPDDGSGYERTLARNYAFRTEQQGVTVLDNWVAEAETGALSVCDFTLQYSSATCRVATPGAAQWRNEAFPAETDMFIAEFYVRPQANSDALLALSAGPQTNWSGLAAIVRFNTSGTIDVRDGNVYRADRALSYTANGLHYVRFEVNVKARTYSVYVDPYQNRDATLIARDYAFRTEQQGVTRVDNSVAEAEVGGIEVCKTKVTPSPCVTSGRMDQWFNNPMGPYYVTSVVEFDAIPMQSASDALIGLSQGPQTDATGLAAIVRFGQSNSIEVRNGHRYDPVMPYIAGQPYHFRLVPWPSEYGGRYWVYITPPGGEQQVINYFDFRDEQRYVRSLHNWALWAEAGGVQVCNFNSRYTHYQDF